MLLITQDNEARYTPLTCNLGGVRIKEITLSQWDIFELGQLPDDILCSFIRERLLTAIPPVDDRTRKLCAMSQRRRAASHNNQELLRLRYECENHRKS